MNLLLSVTKPETDPLGSIWRTGMSKRHERFWAEIVRQLDELAAVAKKRGVESEEFIQGLDEVVDVLPFGPDDKKVAREALRGWLAPGGQNNGAALLWACMIGAGLQDGEDLRTLGELLKKLLQLR